jgi:hypothetical protein
MTDNRWSRRHQKSNRLIHVQVEDLTRLGTRHDTGKIIVFDTVDVPLALFTGALFLALGFILLLLVAHPFALAFFHAVSYLNRGAGRSGW